MATNNKNNIIFSTHQMKEVLAKLQCDVLCQVLGEIKQPIASESPMDQNRAKMY
jgi:ABC-type Na+ transport system ATPase subunit NatA